MTCLCYFCRNNWCQCICPDHESGYPWSPTQGDDQGYPDGPIARPICGPWRGIAAGCADPGGPAHPSATSAYRGRVPGDPSARAPARRERVRPPGDPSVYPSRPSFHPSPFQNQEEAVEAGLMVCIL